MFFDRSYFAATCHPWMSGLYIVAMLLCYEIGVWYCQQGDDLAWRTGIDAGWRYHIRQTPWYWLEWAPAGCVIVSLGVWSLWRWKDKPSEPVATLAGMVLESFVLALPLLALARAVALWGNTTVPGTALTSQRGASILASLGAGVYEEIVFRLILIPVLLAIGRLLDLGRIWRLLLAVVLSGVFFAAAHHIPPFQEPFRQELFVFRVLAGTYFGLVYRFRGIGIAAGTHACYDLLATG
jgi:membrane protease YdiL (CAAX protease family)